MAAVKASNGIEANKCIAVTGSYCRQAPSGYRIQMRVVMLKQINRTPARAGILL
jgi:hypothetical protein